MSTRALLILFLVPLVAVSTACSSGGSAVAPEQPDLTGFYTLNEDESDDPTRLSGMPGRPGGFGGGGANMGMALRIEQTDSTLTIRPVGAGQSMELFTDGRAVSRELRNGATVTTKCSWDGGKLKVERRTAGATVSRGSRGATEVITTYWLEDEGRKLYVKMLTEGRGGPMQYTRVYDAGSGSE